MQVHLCGTRGSTPAPGRDFVRYGGHTSCVAFAHDGEAPRFVVDAGTGIRQLTAILDGEPFRGTIVLSHLHWDHVHGLPFFKAGAMPGSRADVYLPANGKDPSVVLEGGMSVPHFPVGPLELGPGWTYQELSEREYEFEGFHLLARRIPHKGGDTFGFRISDATGSVAYLSDHAPLNLGAGPDGVGVYHPAALELAAGVDLLIHDAQFLKSEFPEVAYLGHAAVEYGVALAEKAGARELLLYHHSPDRTDDEIDGIVAGLSGASLPVTAAADSAVIVLPRPE